MEFYEFAKHFVVCGAFGALVGLMNWSFGYWIYQLVAYICKKVNALKTKKAVNQQDNS